MVGCQLFWPMWIYFKKDVIYKSGFCQICQVRASQPEKTEVNTEIAAKYGFSKKKFVKGGFVPLKNLWCFRVLKVYLHISIKNWKMVRLVTHKILKVKQNT